MRNLFGIPIGKTGRKVKQRDPKAEARAEEKRARKAETMRRNRELGAFDAYREPRGAPTQAAWPGGRARRDQEMARIAARAGQEGSVPFGEDMKARVTDPDGNDIHITGTEIPD